MRSTIIPALLAATLTFGTAALAAPGAVEGTIKSIDAKANSVTLADGVTYMLPKGFKLDGFKAGEKVRLTWQMQGSVHEAETMVAG